MRKPKYSEDVLKKVCEEKGLVFVSIDNVLYNNKTRRSLNFVCERHIDKGIQTRPIEKVINAKKPCQFCNHMKLRETFVEDMANVNPNIEILSVYVNSDVPIKFRCKIDGYEWNGRALDLLKGKGCKQCGHIKLWDSRGRKTTESLQKEMRAVNKNIIIIGEYKGTHTPIKCRCVEDGCEWLSYPCNLLNKSAGCPECRKRRLREKEALANDEFVNRLKKLNKNITPLDTYFNASTKMRFRCETHNCIFTTTPRNFLYKNGRGCPYCSQSSGEKKMVKILEDKGFNIIQQMTFDDCRNIEKLRFDAYDVDNNIAYEYQGQQHYRPVDFAGRGKEWAQEQYEIIRKRDVIKAEYCKKNNIPLIEVPYWEFESMDDFLSGEFSRYLL